MTSASSNLCSYEQMSREQSVRLTCEASASMRATLAPSSGFPSNHSDSKRGQCGRGMSRVLSFSGVRL